MKTKVEKKRAKSKNAKTKKASKRLTAVDIQNMRILAKMLGELVPYSGRGNFNLQNIAKRFNLTKCFPAKHHNKKETFSFFIRDVHKRHPRMMKKIVREIFPKAIERRYEQGNPILLEEATVLSEQLFKIGVDLKKEIRGLRFPKERPKVVPPPYDIQEILKKIKLHPILMPECQKLFLDGHINESVRKALEKYEVYVQRKSSLKIIGKNLMGKAFSLRGQTIKLNALSTESEKNEQEGFMYISMGVMQWWRNTLSHGDEKQISHHEALGRLFLISNLLHRLENCI
ncbi:MAG: TIGR02391 family protein [Candidatus Omnitrophica bacterium]|nr:TIGR02391 family protein [Candidatus Omnitrophota bacterium]